MLTSIQARSLAASLCLALRVAPGATEPPPALESRSIGEMAELARASVVLIIAKTGDEGPFRQGTGFVVGPDGQIATCLHVLDEAREVMVKAAGRRRFTRVLVDGVSAERDLALLHIDARDLPALTLGDSTALGVGDPVVVIGNPLGFSRTVTDGVVGARRVPRLDELDAEGWMEEKFGVSPARDLYEFEVIQISAQATQGSSGAPVLDRRGEVVGIAVGGFGRGFLDLNFAIPVENLKPLLDQRLGLDLPSFRERADDARRELAEPHLGEARIALDLERMEDAERALDRALTLHPRFVEALLLKATLLETAGDYQGAEVALLRAVERGDEESAEAWSRLGELYLTPALREATIAREGFVISHGGGEPSPRAKAMGAFENALKVDDEDARAAFGIGTLHFSAGRYRRAIAWLERSLESDSGLLDAGIQLGEAHRMLSQFGEAEEAYLDVLRKDRDHPLAHFGLANVGIARGDMTLAREHWREFLELSEDDPELAELRERTVLYLSLRRPEALPR